MGMITSVLLNQLKKNEHPYTAITAIVSAAPQQYGSRSDCSGVTVPANDGTNNIHGECLSEYEGQLFCYVQKDGGRCEDYSQKFNVLCICYSCCKSIFNAYADIVTYD